MLEPTEMEDVYSAIEESARLLDVACSRDKIWPILTAYGNELPAEALIVIAMAAGERHGGELDYNFTVPRGGPDPYTVALSNGFIGETEHPVGTLLSDIGEHCPVQDYGVECGVVSGFKKTYAFFPLDDLQGLSQLASIPSMPRALTEHAGTFARYGLSDNVSIIGIDHVRRTMNVYFGRLPAECLKPGSILSMLRDLGLPEPSEQMLEFVQQSFSIYPTFSWDSPKVDRICFSVVSPDAMAFPARIFPEIEKFAKNAPYAYAGERVLVYGATLSRAGEYHKLGVYYRKPPFSTVQLLQEFEKMVGRA